MEIPKTDELYKKKESIELPDNKEAIFNNIFYDVKLLTRDQVLNLINHLSGELLLDERIRNK